MKCPCCGAAELIHDTRDMPYTYKGENTTISAVTGDFCPACGEVVLNREHGDRYSELLGQFQRQGNAAAERLRGRNRLADGKVQEEPFFITEEIDAEMIAAGYVFEPPAHFTTTNARRLFDLRAGETVSEAISRHSAKVE